MAEISKQALKVENNTSFPNNNAGAITPAGRNAIQSMSIEQAKRLLETVNTYFPSSDVATSL